MKDYAKKHAMVIVVPVYEEDITGVYYNTCAVIDADGSYLGKYRKTHIPQVAGFYEKFFFKPGNSGWPVFQTAYCKLRSEEHTSELQSLMRISYAVFCLKKKKTTQKAKPAINSTRHKLAIQVKNPNINRVQMCNIDKL